MSSIWELYEIQREQLICQSANIITLKNEIESINQKALRSRYTLYNDSIKILNETLFFSSL